LLKKNRECDTNALDETSRPESWFLLKNNEGSEMIVFLSKKTVHNIE